jgi:hypothetical protein
MMSRITIHLDGQTDVDLKQFCGSTASTRDEVIKALINVTRNDRYISSRVTDDLSSLHPASPWTSGITVDLGNATDVDLKQWCGEADPAKAIEAMVRVMLRDHHIRDKVRSRLAGPSLAVSGPVDPEPVKKQELGGFSPF